MIPASGTVWALTTLAVFAGIQFVYFAIFWFIMLVVAVCILWVWEAIFNLLV